MNVSELALDCVAGYRLTRLVTADTITARPRDAVVRAAYALRYGEDDADDWEDDNLPLDTWSERAMHDPDAPALATLVTCRWCMGVWIGSAVIVARRMWPRQWQPVAEVAAVAAAAALLARSED